MYLNGFVECLFLVITAIQVGKYLHTEFLNIFLIVLVLFNNFKKWNEIVYQLFFERNEWLKINFNNFMILDK